MLSLPTILTSVVAEPRCVAGLHSSLNGGHKCLALARTTGRVELCQAKRAERLASVIPNSRLNVRGAVPQ